MPRYSPSMDDATIRTPAPSVPRQTTPAGAVAFFGVFAGLCAIFVLFATFADWRSDVVRAQWPVATASIDHGAVEAYRNSRDDAAPNRWRLRYRVRFEVDGLPYAATVATRSTQSSEDAARLEAWAREHRRGGEIRIRYDPAQPAEAQFASEELPGTGSRVGGDLVLLAIAVVACAILLPLGRFLAARQASSPGSGELSRRGSLATGIAVAALGSLEIALGLHSAMVATRPLTPEDFIIVPAGMIFVFAGVLLALSPAQESLKRIFAALLMSAFAITFDSIAFGPGERHFSGGISLGIGVGFNPGEWLGRAVFAIPALIMTSVAAVMWTRLVMRRP